MRFGLKNRGLEGISFWTARHPSGATQNAGVKPGYLKALRLVKYLLLLVSVLACPEAIARPLGAKAGKTRVNPLMYKDLGHGRFAIFASTAGEPTNPDWYHNLVANPRARIELGTETSDVRPK